MLNFVQQSRYCCLTLMDFGTEFEGGDGLVDLVCKHNYSTDMVDFARTLPTPPKERSTRAQKASAKALKVGQVFQHRTRHSSCSIISIFPDRVNYIENSGHRSDCKPLAFVRSWPWMLPVTAQPPVPFLAVA